MENNIRQFSEHVHEYEDWFESYPFVFQSEIEAVREMLPEGEHLSGIEIGLGTGRYAQALGIKEGIEPSDSMSALAHERGVETMRAKAESLPYHDLRFDFAVMLFCVSYFQDVTVAFKEAYRVLKRNGCLIVGFLDRNSTIGKAYELRKPDSVFYRQATFYSPTKIIEELKEAGFRHFKINQTLFGELDSIKTRQTPKAGFGEGSFVVVKALKKETMTNS